MIKFKKNCRGFRCGSFKDSSGEECSLQESSAVEPCVWLGIDKIVPRVMSIHVPGLQPPKVVPDEDSTATTGWQSYILPENVEVFGRMHLDREQAREIGRHLLYFARHGVLPNKLPKRRNMHKCVHYDDARCKLNWINWCKGAGKCPCYEEKK